jgi:hypothetical protein
MLYREIIAVCSQIHTKHINTLCGQNIELLNVKPGGIYSNHKRGEAKGGPRFHMAWSYTWNVRTLTSMQLQFAGSEVFTAVQLRIRPATWHHVAGWVVPDVSKIHWSSGPHAHHTNSSNWETLASRRKLSRLCALHKAYSGERAWKAIGDRLKRPQYLSRVDHERKIWNMR